MYWLCKRAAIWSTSAKQTLDRQCPASAEGRGAYAAIDAVGGEMTKHLSLALRDGGTVYVYGALSGDPIQVDTLDTLYKYKKVEVQTHA